MDHTAASKRTGKSKSKGATDFRPATPDRWSDLEQLFGERGACGGCWCMWFRLPRQQYEAGKGARNRRRLKALVDSGTPPGILAYRGETPVGWCSIAPRSEYLRLKTTRTMKSPDDLPVWAILCLYVDPDQRRSGLSVELIAAAAHFAAERGAPAIEAYPIIPRQDEVPPVFASQGLLSAYLAAGFEEVARPSETRAVVRKTVSGER